MEKMYRDKLDVSSRKLVAALTEPHGVLKREPPPTSSLEKVA
mgnify:CR=1 FL=1